LLAAKQRTKESFFKKEKTLKPVFKKKQNKQTCVCHGLDRPALPATRFARSDVPPSLRAFCLVQGRAPRLLLVSEDSRASEVDARF